MKKEFLFMFVITCSFMFSLMFLQNVDAAAYAETAFVNESCITSETWTENAMTEYKFNEETGVYETSGESYTAYSEAGKTDKHIFYLASTDGKLLYAFVPNYGTLVTTAAGKDEL